MEKKRTGRVREGWCHLLLPVSCLSLSVSQGLALTRDDLTEIWMSGRGRRGASYSSSSSPSVISDRESTATFVLPSVLPSVNKRAHVVKQIRILINRTVCLSVIVFSTLFKGARAREHTFFNLQNQPILFIFILRSV